MAADSRFAPHRSFPGMNRLAHAWQHGDRFYHLLITLAALSVLGLVIAIGYELWQSSALSRQAFGLGFVTSTDWDPALNQSFGALPFILGTLVTSFLGLII